MTETAPVLKPKWQFILGLLPSLNSSIVAVVAAALSVASTLAVQRYKAPEKPSESLHLLTLIKGDTALCVDAIQALRSEFKTPKAGLPAAKAAKK